MRCERSKRRHIKILAQMFSLFVKGLLLGKGENVESPNQSREVDMVIGEKLIKVSVHIVDRKGIRRKIVRS